MCLEVEISRQDTCTDQLLLQDLYKVQQVLRLTTTNVIHRIRDCLSGPFLKGREKSPPL